MVNKVETEVKKNKIVKYIFPTILVILLFAIVLNAEWVTNKIADLLEKDPVVVIGNKNIYSKNEDFEFVQESDNFKPYSYQGLLNIYFSVINNGWEQFTFYCPSEYTECLEDVKTISENEVLLTHINNYTHPYNNYNNIKTTFYESGEVTIEIDRLYNEEDIRRIDEKINALLPTIINGITDDEEKILAIHDWLVNNTKYDQQKNDTGYSPYRSSIAYGAFFEGYALCGGYSDAMALFLTEIGIKNYKVASDSHVWNAVYINNEWLHLDATWDDPVSKDGKDNIWHKYFLIPTSKFKELDKPTETDHIFDKSVYLEMK